MPLPTLLRSPAVPRRSAGERQASRFLSLVSPDANAPRPDLLSASLTLGYAASASAQQIDAATRATARQLGEEGMASFDRGDCTVAANKLTRAHDLVHVPTLAFYAGKCLEKLGRLVEAGET